VSIMTIGGVSPDNSRKTEACKKSRVPFRKSLTRTLGIRERLIELSSTSSTFEPGTKRTHSHLPSWAWLHRNLRSAAHSPNDNWPRDRQHYQDNTPVMMEVVVEDALAGGRTLSPPTLVSVGLLFLTAPRTDPAL
jgi:hypothetical protein